MRSYHVPQAIGCQRVLFKAGSLLPDYRHMDDSINHWPLSHGCYMPTYIVPGDHFTLHLEPNVSVLCDYLQQALQMLTL
jgi:hypothetical protein